MATRLMMTDAEIQAEIRKRSTEELKLFQVKLRKLDTRQAFAIRFFIVQELLFRHMSGDSRITRAEAEELTCS
jgi:hypothetical protein